MNVEPIGPQKARRWALLAPGWRTLTVTDEGGTTRYNGARACYDAIDALAGTVLYTSSGLSEMRHSTGALAWEADVWRGRATAMHLAGTKAKVLSLRGTLDECAEPAVELARALGWLRERGVAAAGISSMAWALWRRSLARPLSISGSARLGKAAFYGGRQEVRARGTGVYQHMQVTDLVAAYAHAMAARPYGLRLTPVSPSTELDPTVAGLADAKVVVPFDMPYAPLPHRLGPESITFATGELDGIWPWCELAAAKELGADVKVRQAWAPLNEAEPFTRWWEWVREGRALGGGAGRLIKAVANSTWGLFAMAGDDRSRVRWTTDTGDVSTTVALKPLKLPQTNSAHIAAETAARVRTRMLLEALYGPGPGPVHIDTDGMVVRKSSTCPEPAGERPGEWRVKTPMREVEIRAPQCYRYRCEPPCADCRFKAGWHYVTAGMGPSAARGVFERLGSGCRFAFMGLDIVLPTRNTAETDALRADAISARAYAGMAFGPGLG